MSNLNKLEIEAATEEVDVPRAIPAPSPETVPSAKVKSLEEEKFEHKKAIDRWGFLLLIISVALYFFMYLIEKITYTEEMSRFTATISETMKFLISSLIGYLFATKSQ